MSGLWQSTTYNDKTKWLDFHYDAKSFTCADDMDVYKDEVDVAVEVTEHTITKASIVFGYNLWPHAWTITRFIFGKMHEETTEMEKKPKLAAYRAAAFAYNNKSVKGKVSQPEARKLQDSWKKASREAWRESIEQYWDEVKRSGPSAKNMEDMIESNLLVVKGEELLDEDWHE